MEGDASPVFRGCIRGCNRFLVSNIMKDDTIIRFHYIKELQGEIFNKVIVG